MNHFATSPVVFADSGKTIACGRVIEREGGSKTAPFTLPLPGACIIFEGYAFCNSPAERSEADEVDLR